MKRWGFLLVVVVVTGLGCLPPSMKREEQALPAPAAEAPAPPPPPPVKAEEITEQNATEKLKALREEIERERGPNRPARQEEQ